MTTALRGAREPDQRAGAAGAYVICTNPRSGSWLLSEALASTKVAGVPREWFNRLEEAQWNASAGERGERTTYLDHVLAVGRSSNGVFGLKLHWYQMSDLQRHVVAATGVQSGPPQGNPIAAVLPNARYVWLTRRDKARQAISYHRACRTNQWWDIGGVRLESTHPDGRRSRYDAEAIRRLEHLLVGNDRQWASFFERNDIRPLVVTYEALAGRYDATVRKVLAYLGLTAEAPAVLPPKRLRRQADATTDRWLAKYRQFRASAAGRRDPVGIPTEPLATARRPRDRTSGIGLTGVGPASVEPRPSGVPDAWREWAARGQVSGMTDAAIADVMVANGITREAAEAEIAAAAASPYLRVARLYQRRHARAARLMAALDALASQRPDAAVVPRRAALTADAFFDDYYAANRPVVMTGLIGDWPAMTRWTPAYLKRRAGAVTVEVMARRDGDPLFEVNAAQHRTSVRFADFVDLAFGGRETNDSYLVANNGFFQRRGGRGLLADVGPVGELLDPAGMAGQTFLWLGPGGTVTPLHHDPCNLLMAQVVGRKRVTMVPALQWPLVQGDNGFFAEVDPERPDANRWPLFARARLMRVDLGPGDVLFMPVGWWHHVRTLEPSAMVSFTNFRRSNHYAW